MLCSQDYTWQLILSVYTSNDYTTHDESHGELDSKIEYTFEDSNSRSGKSSSFGQEDGDCNETCKEYNEGNDENQDCPKDRGEDLMRYI